MSQNERAEMQFKTTTFNDSITKVIQENEVHNASDTSVKDRKMTGY